MCGRYTLAADSEAIARRFGVSVPAGLPRRYNIAPSQDVLAVRERPAGERELVGLQWGLVPFWADEAAIGNRLVNARSETAASKPAFRAAFRHRRCLVVADGFYEWQVIDGRRQPCYFSLHSGGPFGFAGLWERWDKQGEPLETCTILTREADEFMRPFHERMPVIVAPELFAAWLAVDPPEPAVLQQVLKPPSGLLAVRPVSTRVNNVRHDGPECIAPLALQGRLFGDSSS